MVQAEGSSLVEMLTNSFSNNFDFVLGVIDLSDTAIKCSRPNSCCQQNPKCFDKPFIIYFPRVCFYERTAMTVKLN